MAETEPTNIQGDPPEGEPVELLIRQYESKQYRGIHVSGVMGGLNNLGEIYVGVYAERKANLDALGLTVFPDGSQEYHDVPNSGIPGVVREIEAGLYMSIDTAENFGLWLVERARTYRAAYEEGMAELAARRAEAAKDRE